MTITKCDVCKKEIPREATEVTVSLESPCHYFRRTICTACGKPIMAFVQRHNLDSKNSRRAA